MSKPVTAAMAAALRVWLRDVGAAFRTAWVRSERTLWERAVDVVRDVAWAGDHARNIYRFTRRGC